MNNLQNMKKKLNNYAFIDGQNLYLAIQELGWKLDYKKFRIYLREKYAIEKAYMFMGFLPANQELYNFLQTVGFVLIFKPVLENDKNLDINNKLLKVLAPSTHNCSSLLTKIAGNKISFVSDLRKKLEYIKKEPHKDGTS